MYFIRHCMGLAPVNQPTVGTSSAPHPHLEMNILIWHLQDTPAITCACWESLCYPQGEANLLYFVRHCMGLAPVNQPTVGASSAPHPDLELNILIWHLQDTPAITCAC